MALVWEEIELEHVNLGRFNVVDRAAGAKVPGGWLIAVTASDGGGLAFYSDPAHQWNGGSPPEPGGPRTGDAATRGTVQPSED